MMRPLAPAQLSPMGRNLLKQHLMAHAHMLHQKRVQSMAQPLQPHVSQFVPQQPMLGGGQPPAPVGIPGMPGSGGGGF